MSTTQTTYRIGPSPLHGRGVFAKTRIRKGTTIMRNPALVVRKEAGELIDYVFHWDGGVSALALGPLSLCNHSRTPNAEVLTIDDEFLLVATRGIDRGEEILIDYGPEHPVGEL